jgi:hypothetical protein
MVDAGSHLSQEERWQRPKRLEQARRRARQKPERGRVGESLDRLDRGANEAIGVATEGPGAAFLVCPALGG